METSNTYNTIPRKKLSKSRYAYILSTELRSIRLFWIWRNVERCCAHCLVCDPICAPSSSHKDSSEAIDSGSTGVSDLVRKLDTVKDELRAISEELYKTREDQKHLSKEVDDLNTQLQIVDKNQASLHLTLTKLRGKQETHRARASGAVRIWRCLHT